MKYDEYDSPFILNIIDRMTTQIPEELDKMAYSAVLKAGIVVDRDILLQGLKQDSERYREAYRRGYETGYTEKDDEIVRCKDCEHVCMCDATEMFPDIPVYAKCTLTDEVHEPDWFCADGEKRE